MRKLSITCGTTDSRETVGFNFKLETLRGDTWLSEGDVNVASNTPEAQRTIELEGNQRLVITAIGADVETVYDRENNATVTKAAFDTMPDEGKRQQTEEDRQRELREKRYSETKMNTAADRAAEQERDRVLEEQRERERAHHDHEVAKQSGANAPLKPPAAPVVPPRTGVSSSPSGGMAASGPSTGGQSSKDVKNG
jgi:hypothetical protein